MGACETASMELAERILQLLGRGLSGSIVASAVGCDPSYISQLMEDTEFRRKVQELRATGAEEAIARDGRWDSLEQKALEKMEAVIPLVTRPADIIRIAQIANAAKRTAKELANGSDTSAPIVQLIMPQSAVIHFQMNTAAQVVEVDGRSMAPLPTKHLQEVMKEKQQLRLTNSDNGEITQVEIPQAVVRERRKVESVLEQIGFADEAVPVENILDMQETGNSPQVGDRA